MKQAGLWAVMVCAGILAVSPASAQKLERVFHDWNVFTVNQGGKKVCYIASAPVSKKGNYNKRGEPYALVTHRSASVDEVSVSSGYPYKTKSDVKARIDGKHSFNMFTKDELAWTYTEADDKKMVASMKKGNKMSVRGTSKKNTYSQDTYSLKGFTAAYKHMKTLCK